MLRQHLRSDAERLQTVSYRFPRFRHACLQNALDAFASKPEYRTRLHGISNPHGEPTISEMLQPQEADSFRICVPKYEDVPLLDGMLTCISFGIFLCRNNRTGDRFAMLIQAMPYSRGVNVEVVARHRELAHSILKELKLLADQFCVYRNHAISLAEDHEESVRARFHQVRKLADDELILEPKTISEIERHTVRFSEFKEHLKNQKRHLKRGILLYGPPGTGKSMTVSYLLSKMSGRSTILIHASGMRQLSDACDHGQLN